jgi:sugar diacid utilization regulator
MLTALYRQDRATFDKLVERVGQIKELVAEQEAMEALAEHRALLEPAVEAGLLNQAEADRKLAAWAKSNGIRIPK